MCEPGPRPSHTPPLPPRRGGRRGPGRGRAVVDIDMDPRKYCRCWLQSVDEDDTIEGKALPDLWEDQPEPDSDDSDGRSDEGSEEDDT